MINRILAGLGVGGARVNLVLDQPRVELGGTLTGTIKISSGSVDQHIEQIYINLLLRSAYITEDGEHCLEHTVGTLRAAEGLTVRAGAPEISLPVELQLPFNIPISYGKTAYYLQTGLDIKRAVDPKDLDPVTILPHPPLRLVLEALHHLGMWDKPASGSFNGRYQLFEYRPTTFLAGQLDELEVYITSAPDRLHMVMQIDKKIRGAFSKLVDDMDLDERHVGFTLFNRDLQSVPQVAEMLRDIIESEYRKIPF